MFWLPRVLHSPYSGRTRGDQDRRKWIQSSPCISNVLKLRRLNILHHIKRCSIDLKFWLNLLNSYLVDRSKILVDFKVNGLNGFCATRTETMGAKSTQPSPVIELRDFYYLSLFRCSVCQLLTISIFSTVPFPMCLTSYWLLKCHTGPI